MPGLYGDINGLIVLLPGQQTRRNLADTDFEAVDMLSADEVTTKIANAVVVTDWDATTGTRIINKPTIPAAQVNSDWNATSGLAQILNKPTIPAIPARSFATPNRTLNSVFQIDTNRDALVSYSVDITTTLTLTGGAASTVYLEYADNSGFTTNVKEIGHFTTSNTGTLVVGITLNQQATARLGGVIPAGKYVRLRTNNTTGTPTYGTPVCQEVLL